MRIFHLADLHVGKKLNNVSLIEDQRMVLEQVLQAIVQRRPDVLVLAGDIYDRRNPAVEAVNLLDEFLSEVILGQRVPVLAIGGNHDSGERLGFANGILAKAGLHLTGRLTVPVPAVTLEDQWGKVHFHLLPYADLATIKYELADDSFEDYQEAMAALLATIEAEMADGERHVLIAHGVVTGVKALEESDSERQLTIGGTENWSSDLLRHYAYVALGHLHHSQSTGLEKIRYAGSLLKYSFSEEKQVKNLVQVDLGAKSELALDFIPLRPLRDLRTIQGDLQSLLEPEQVALGNAEDFIRVVLTDHGEVLEPMAALRKVYPNTLVLERLYHPLSQSLADELGSIAPQNKTPEALFAQFYQQMTAESMADHEMMLLQKVFRLVKEAE